MARILLVDPSEMARRAMKGILARGEHKFAAVEHPGQAWTFLRANPGVDLIFTGLQLEGQGNGIGFVQELKAHPFLQHAPVVVYTGHADRNAVRRAVDLHVQNFLVKPYHDDDIFAEIDKAEANPWRDRFFEEERSFCKMMGIAPADLQRMLRDLHYALGVAAGPLAKCAELADYRPAADLISPLRDQAESAGAWAVVEAFTQLSALAGENKWAAWAGGLETLDYATRLVASRLDPDRGASPDFYSHAEQSAAAEAAERAVWLAAPAAKRCPMVPWDKLQREIEGLRGCPVIDSAAAAFQMVANGHPSCINPLMDLVARDPGLSAQMLVAANAAHPPASEEAGRIEDARLAVGQLGEVRLEAQARNLVIAEERIMDLPPTFSWPRFWTFQRGVARIAQVTCRDLEFYSLEPVARGAAQLHDIGKLILAHLHPAGFQAILEHARVHGVPLPEAEKLFLGGTTAQMAAHFADRFGLSRRFANVMRWVEDPTAATEDRNLVAIISLARDLCRHNLVGASGDPVREQPVPIAETPEWAILHESIYPSFNLTKFEEKIHAHCRQLRTEFSGHQAGTVGELVANATA